MEALDNLHGYDDLLFVPRAPEYVHCTVCSFVLRDPVQLLGCGHKLCSICFERIKSYAWNNNRELQCPIDRSVVDLNDVREDIAVRRLVRNLTVHCLHRGRGCSWVGDLSELEVHIGKCPFECQQKVDSAMVPSFQELEKIKDRLDHYEHASLEKDKKIVLVKYDQQQLAEDVQALKQQQQKQQTQQKQMQTEFRQQKQHQQQQQWNQKEQLQQLQNDLFSLKTQNEMLTKKVLELEQYGKNQRKQQQQQQQLRLLQSEMVALKTQNKMLKENMLQQHVEKRQKHQLLQQQMETSMDVATFHKKVKLFQSKKQVGTPAGTDISSNPKSNIQEKEQTTMDTGKHVIVQHHCGDIRKTTIDNENRSVVFRGGIATVSLKNLVLPPDTKVWYEVQYTHFGGRGWCRVGWATPDLATAQTNVNEQVRNGIGNRGLNSFSAYKLHNGVRSWGKNLTDRTGVVGVALDLAKGEILYSVDGQWRTTMSVAFTGVPTEKKFFPSITGESSTLYLNFGDRTFKYDPPDRTYKALIDIV